MTKFIRIPNFIPIQQDIYYGNREFSQEDDYLDWLELI